MSASPQEFWLWIGGLLERRWRRIRVCSSARRRYRPGSDHKLLPIHFGTAGLGSAAALLELLGHRIAPLNAIGLFAAAIETVLLIA